MFKPQSSSKYSPFYAKHLLRHFFHCSKQFLNSSILMPFSSSAVFLCHLFHISKMFPFENFFHPGKQQKCCSGKIGWIGRVATGVMLFFNQKLLNTQHGVGRCAWKSPIMKWANELKESSKKIYWCWMKPLTKPPPSTLMHMGPRTLPQQRKPVLQGPTLPEDNSRVFGSPLVSGRESNWIQYNLQYITCYGTHNVK